MSANYLQILELASKLSKEECILLIKDISTALIERGESLAFDPEYERQMFKNALETRAKVLSGEMKTWSFEEVKEKLNARKQA
ncbi:MAG: hypothetical protein AAFR87_34300 [Bacteroidota bacterium]